MKKWLNLSLVLILLFQSFVINLGMGNVASAEGNQDIVEDISIEADEDGNAAIKVTWRVTESVEKDTSYKFTTPDDIKIAERQKGDLEFADEKIGTYKVAEDGIVTLTLDEDIEEDDDVHGEFTYSGQTEEAKDEDEADQQAESSDDANNSEENAAENESDNNQDENNADDAVNDTDKKDADEKTKDNDVKDDADNNEEDRTDKTDAEDKADKKQDKAAQKRSIQATADHCDSNAEKEGFSFALDSASFNDEEISEDNPLDPDLAFWLKMSWELADGHNYCEGDEASFDLPKGIQIIADDEGELKTETGEVVASYKLSTDGTVTLTFTDFVENNSEVKGWLEIMTELNKDEVEEEDGKIVIEEMNDEGHLEIPVNMDKVKNSLEKQGQANKRYNADSITWTVTVNKNGISLNDALLEDILPDGTIYKEGSLKVEKQKVSLSGKPIGNAEAVDMSPSVKGQNLSVSLGDISDMYVITYETTMTDDEKNDDTRSYENKVSLNSQSHDDMQAKTTVKVNRGEPLKKGAVKDYNAKTGEIEWFLEFNYNQKNLKDVKLEDTWTVGELQKGKVELVEDSVQFQEMTIDENGQAHKEGDPKTAADMGQLEKFEDGFNVSGITTDKPYYVTYKTKVTERQLDEFRIENIAAFGGHEAGQGYDVGQYIGAKSAGNIDYKNKTIEWTIRVNMDERPMKDVVITDEVGQGQELLADTIEMTIDGEPTNDYTLENDNPFVLKDIGNIDKELIVVYKTKFDADNVPDYKPTNKVDIDWLPENSSERINKDLKVNTKLNKETADSSWKNASYDPDSKEITWEIVANYRENLYEALNVIDTSQGNQKLLEDSFEIHELDIQENGKIEIGDKVDLKPSIDDQTFTIDFGNTNKAYGIRYKTSIEGLDDVSKTYKNTGTVNDDTEELSPLKAEVDVYKGNKYGKKTGKQDGKQVHWAIGVNNAQEKINNLELTDKISDNQAYLEDTIKVYHASVDNNGNFKKGDLVDHSEYQLTLEESEFNIAWQDEIERPYIVEYSTLFFAGHDEKVSNNYAVTGDSITEEGGSNGGSEVTIKQTSSGGAQGTAGYLMIEKVDSTYGQDNKPLSGIDFELIDQSTDKVLKTVTTNEEGYADFGRLLFGTYDLKEVNVPEGYVTPKEKQEVTIDKEFVKGESDPKDFVKEIENFKPNHNVELLKTNENGDFLEGAEFTLYDENDKKVAKQVTDEAGELSFENLEPGDYYLQETKAPYGYELNDKKRDVEIIEKQRDAIQLEAVNKRKTTSVTLEKKWQDESDKDRPASITVNLFQNDHKLETYEMKAEDDWKLTIDNLPAEDSNGDAFEYSVTEQEVTGYNSSIDETGKIITNTRAQEKEIDILKSWNDDENAENKRPDTIEVELFRAVSNEKAESVDTYTLTADNDWALHLSDLPMFNEAGKAYHYSIKEKTVENYQSEIDGFDLSNTLVGKTDISGQKVWKDADAKDQRPDDITVHLLANGEKVDKQIVSQDEDWSYSFEELEKYDEDGKKIAYTVEEEALDGYETNVDGFDITNTIVGKTSISGEKTWQDDDSEDRPKVITINLLANGQALDSTEVTAEDDWTYQFDDLDQYDAEGKTIEYTVTEDEVEGYEVKQDGTDFINTRVGEKSINIDKQWQDDDKTDRPNSIKVDVLQDDEVFETVEVTAEEVWSTTVTDLPKYDEKGVEYTYSLAEHDVKGYESEVDGETIANTRTEDRDIDISKTWLDDDSENRPDSIEVDLTRHIVDGHVEKVDTYQLSKDDNWRLTIEDLAAYDEQGQSYIYEIAEKEIEGYDVTIDGFDLTNTRVGETSIDIDKQWQDDDKSDRPDSIKVNIFQNDDFLKEVEIFAENDWSTTVDGLAKYDDQGVEYTYTIAEQDVAGYESDINDYTITNTRTEEKSIDISKTWQDEDDSERPDEIQVELFRSVKDGDKASVNTYTVAAENDWKLEIDQLPAFDEQGQAYTYEISEKAVEGYETEINGFDITNTSVGKTEVSGEKTWQDPNADHRPESITVILLANGKEIDSQKVTSNKDWVYTFADLNKYDDKGQTIDYSIAEKDVEGYQTEIDGYDLTNTRVAETDISGEKTWVDKDNKDRPRSIIVNLLANDEKIDSQLVTAEDDWHYTFMTLDKYDREGQLINYTISEEEVEGYQTEIDGYDLINTLIEDESETPGHDPSKDSNDDPDKIEKQSDDDKDGENLPKTATNTYNLILFGLAIVIIGVLLSFFLRRKTN